jgi:hypothetical protein
LLGDLFRAWLALARADIRYFLVGFMGGFLLGLLYQNWWFWQFMFRMG